MNKRLKKIAILSALSTSLLTGCSDKKEAVDKTTELTTEITTELNTQEEFEIVSNQTIATIYEQYKQQSNEDIDIKNLEIEEFDLPNYIWKKGEDYIYDYRINGDNTEGYTYIDPGYYSKMYVVKIKKEDNNYEIIAALAHVDYDVFNVRVTIREVDGSTKEASEIYIYIENPTMDNIDEMKNADKYINADEQSREPAIQKEAKKVNILK